MAPGDLTCFYTARLGCRGGAGKGGGALFTSTQHFHTSIRMLLLPGGWRDHRLGNLMGKRAMAHPSFHL